jgi:acetyltransferase-like isoleucine patch superfamily enzyme
MEAFWQRYDSLRHLAYTMVMKGRFASWGAGARLGRGARLVRPELVCVGDRVFISEYGWLNATDDRKDGKPTLYVGDDTYIGRFVHINAWQDVRIGRQVLIADRVFISDCGHQYNDPEVPIQLQPDPFLGPVRLDDGCWIGVGAVILPGVHIGRNAVVAANSVVKTDVPAGCVAVGAPARIIRRAEVS